MKKIQIAYERPSYRTREELNELRTNIQFCGADKKVVVITSCTPGEGKTKTAINLAVSFAELQKNVLLIDADMRKSVMPKRLGLDGVDEGLSHFLSGQCALADTVTTTNIPRLHILFGGAVVPNPTELLASERFASMIESFREVYDYIIIDSAPLGLVVDSSIIAKETDGAILVIESGKVKYRLVQEVKKKLETAECSVLGVVLNKVDHKKNRGYYSKYYGKEYGSKKYGSYYGDLANKEKE